MKGRSVSKMSWPEGISFDVKHPDPAEPAAFTVIYDGYEEDILALRLANEKKLERV